MTHLSLQIYLLYVLGTLLHHEVEKTLSSLRKVSERMTHLSLEVFSLEKTITSGVTVRRGETANLKVSHIKKILYTLEVTATRGDSPQAAGV